MDYYILLFGIFLIFSGLFFYKKNKMNPKFKFHPLAIFLFIIGGIFIIFGYILEYFA